VGMIGGTRLFDEVKSKLAGKLKIPRRPLVFLIYRKFPEYRELIGPKIGSGLVRLKLIFPNTIGYLEHDLGSFFVFGMTIALLSVRPRDILQD